MARQAGALAGPIASPFHSERVQNEVQLQCFRPATLHKKNGRRTGASFEGRPSLESGNTERKEGPRVARVEAHEEGPEKGTLEETSVGDPQAPGPSGAGPQVALRLNDLAAGVATEEMAQEPRNPTEGEGSLALVAMDSGLARPCPRDQRELVPAGVSGVDVIMGKLLEENKLLKQRLEMLEGGQPALGDLGTMYSPVSFASEGLKGQLVQSRSERTVPEGVLGVGNDPYGQVGRVGVTSGYSGSGSRPTSFEPPGDPGRLGDGA